MQNINAIYKIELVIGDDLSRRWRKRSIASALFKIARNSPDLRRTAEISTLLGPSGFNSRAFPTVNLLG